MATVNLFIHEKQQESSKVSDYYTARRVEGEAARDSR